MEHLLNVSKCSIFQNVDKSHFLQRCQNAYLWSEGVIVVAYRLTFSLLRKLSSAKYIVCIIFKHRPIFIKFGGTFCLVVKQLKSRSDSELLGVWSGFKPFE